MKDPISQLSIVIPTLNEEHYLPRVLDHIAKQQWSGKIQVIIADGESKDATVSVAKTFKDRIPDLTVVTSHDRTIGGARNIGASVAKYDHILFIDCDIFLPPNFLAEFLPKVRTDRSMLVFVLHLPSKFNLVDYLWTFAVFAFYSIYQLFNPFCSGTFLFISKDIFEKVGGFKEGLRMAEDIDLSNRAIKAGATFKFFYRPYVFASTRRMHEVGWSKMLFFWMKGYFDSLRSKEGVNKAAKEYVFGDHKPGH